MHKIKMSFLTIKRVRVCGLLLNLAIIVQLSVLAEVGQNQPKNGVLPSTMASESTKKHVQCRFLEIESTCLAV